MCIVKASGTRTSYGEKLVKKWGVELNPLYGKSYDITKQRKNATILFNIQIWATVSLKLSWSHIKQIISFKSEKNYYINQIVLNNLSTRELICLIKSNAYECLSNKIKI